MKKFILMSIIVLCVSGVAYGKQGDTNFTKIYQASNGSVTFNHQVHSERINSCDTCHLAFDSYGKVDKDFAHKVCKSCHQGSTDKKLPVKCVECHVK